MRKQPISPQRREWFGGDDKAFLLFVLLVLFACNDRQTVYTHRTNIILERWQVLYTRERFAKMMNMSGRWVDGVFQKLSKTFHKIFYNSSNQWTIVTLVWYDDLVWMGTMKFQWNANEVPVKWQAVSTYKSDKSDKNINNNILRKSSDLLDSPDSAVAPESPDVEDKKEDEAPHPPPPPPPRRPPPQEKRQSDFEKFWALYPLKKSKQAAEKKYKTITKHWWATHDEIMAWLTQYITHIRKSKTESDYIKHPSTWLHQWCWNDEYTIKLTTPQAKPRPVEKVEPPKEVLPRTNEEAAEIKNKLSNRKRFLKNVPLS